MQKLWYQLQPRDDHKCQRIAESFKKSAIDDAVGCRAKAGNAIVECGQTLKWFWIENMERKSQTKKQQNPSRRLASLDRIRRNKTSQLKTSKLKSKKKTIFNQSVFSTIHRWNTTHVTRSLIMTGVVLTFSGLDLKHDYLHFSTQNA